MNQSGLNVVVRDYDTTQILRDVDDWDALTLVAAVSADPRCLRELELSWLRYRPDQPLDSLTWDVLGQPSASTETVDLRAAKTADWLLVDLACLRLESNIDGLIPAERTALQRDEGQSGPENPVIWINLPPTWTISSSQNDQPQLQPLLVPVEPIDFRGVLFGRALSSHLAAKMIELANDGRMPDEFISRDDLGWDIERNDPRLKLSNRWYDLTMEVHADWLMAPRSDLGNEPPRVFLHRSRQWAEWEVQNREHQWSRSKRPPRPLDRNTHTYRYGPMHREEVVIYFDLCREVIPFGWRTLFEQPALRDDPHQFASMMYQHMQQWLKEGSIEGDPTPPAEMIESSRRHMPRLADGTHLDCECPLCRMMLDEMEDADSMFYPTFGGFDGHHLELDGEFAFSLYETREEFDEAEADFCEMSESMEREQAKRESQTARGEESEEFQSAWSGYVNPDLTRVDVMTLGFRLAELVDDLKSIRNEYCQESRVDHVQDAVSNAESLNSQLTTKQDDTLTTDLIELLNEQFDNLRGAPPIATDRRIAIQPLIDAIEQTAEHFPRLLSKSADLQSQLHQWVRQAVP